MGTAIVHVRSVRALLVVALALALVVAATWIGRGPFWQGAAEPIRIGAVFPLGGNAAGLAGQQLRGLRIAADLVNADGGIGGRPVALDVRDLESRDDAPAVMAALKAAGASVVIGAYSSDLSMAASAAAAAEGLVYWEGGAVADRLTGRGLPLVFRVGASGANLGAGSATFAATQLAPRLGRTAAVLRVAVVNANDEYAMSVADAVVATAAQTAMPIVSRTSYELAIPDWPRVMADLAASRPDVIILASHIPDGIAFRQAMLAAGVHAPALIGTTMAECDPDFAGELGPDAIGVFASDRPTGGFQPSALDPDARRAYDRLAAAWATAGGSHATGGGAVESPEASGGAGGGDYYGGYDGAGGSGYGGASGSEYAIEGPIEESTPAAGPTEEGLSGFTAGWVLFEHVLSAALRGGSLDAQGVAAAARALDLPVGSLPNGAGVRFSADPATLGQNERAAAVIWQWQAVRSYTFVWPATYATGSIEFVPLSR